ncbi:MAG: hypothetical protein E6J47_04315 [Chloroflexi bacterium]|nr:MAG: hypothetical protein E6J47_04315 [Chloroflexota bacterium]
MTFREFSGKNVEEAVRSAMKEYAAELADLDIEILSAGSRGILGVGGEEARILAAPKSAVAAAETVRAPKPEPERAPQAPPPAEAADAEAADDAGDQMIELARAEARQRVERPPRAGGRGRDRVGTAPCVSLASRAPTDRPESPHRSSPAGRSTSSRRRSAAR